VKKVKFDKIIETGIPILCGVLLGFIVLVTFLQIVLRQFFNTCFNWSDEVSQFCMMWITLFGSIWLTKSGQHLNTGIKLHRKLNEKQIRLIDGILELVISAIAVIVAYQGIKSSFAVMNMGSLSLGWLKMGYVFIALPLSMLAVCYYYFKRFLKSVLL
jgi:TRAP-type C4-dicarboxylate transport system permease small subunit